MTELTQGSIIYGIRSEKYQEQPCYAIIISARCDIANEKISKLYYLAGVDVKDWIYTYSGIDEVCKSLIKQEKKECVDALSNLSLNYSVLMKFTNEEAMNRISEEEPDTKKFSKLWKRFDILYRYEHKSMTLEDKREWLKLSASAIRDFIKGIRSGKTMHYFIMPESAYSARVDQQLKGIIVDLQEICVMEIKDAKKIISPGIDYRNIMTESLEERQRLEKEYWLEKDSFVAIEGEIKSPWCEFLLQRFAFDFSRIGVDNVTDAAIDAFVSDLKGGK